MFDRRLLTLLFIVCLNLFGVGAAIAQDGAEAKKPPPGFEAVAGKDTDKVDPNPLVIGAYACFFFGVFGYVIYVAKRQSDIAAEMAELAERINRVEKK